MYYSNVDLPLGVRQALPSPELQDVYRMGYNSGLAAEEDPERAAWDAVRLGWVQIAGEWMPVLARPSSAQVRAHVLKAFDPNQPRNPKGDAEGGQWTDGGGNSVADWAAGTLTPPTKDELEAWKKARYDLGTAAQQAGSSLPREREVNVPIGDLTPIQRKFSEATAQSYVARIKAGEHWEPPSVYRYQGKLLVEDGHHRVAAAARSGGKVVVDIVDLDAAAALYKAYDPNQPRDPAGSETGGQWTDAGTGPAPRRELTGFRRGTRAGVTTISGKLDPEVGLVLGSYQRDQAFAIQAHLFGNTPGDVQHGWRKGKFVRVPPKEYFNEKVSHIDAIFKQTKINANLLAYRGMAADDFATLNNLVGRVATTKGYMSTSLKRGVARQFGDGHMVEIVIPKGSRGFHMSDAGGSTFINEGEVLLPRNSKFYVGRTKRGTLRLVLLKGAG